MQYKFLNIFFDKKDLLAQEKMSVNQFLLENNASQLEKIHDFYNNDSDILCVNGFSGTGKAHIVNYSLAYLSSEVIVLKYNCFESTILDDILLSFYAEFKKLTVQKIISEPKIRTENFAQKINAYFSHIEKPFLVVINSFESILAENRQEILDFLLHLSSYSKVKIIMISKTFESDYYTSQIKYDRVNMQALTKDLFEKYLKSEKIKPGGMLLDEFYKYSRGYYFYTALSVRIMGEEGLSLADFLAEYNKSFLTFDNYLKTQAMDMIPATIRNLFWFLSMVRHPVSVDLLKTLNLYEVDKIEFLIKNLILNEDDSGLYIKEYFNEQADIEIAPNIAQKLHQYIIDLYQTQLPLKPLERNILISRHTMRKEIQYHTLFLPKKPKNLDGGDFDINYLAYAKGLEFEYGPLKSKDEKADSKKQEVSAQKELEQVELRSHPTDLSGIIPTAGADRQSKYRDDVLSDSNGMAQDSAEPRSVFQEKDLYNAEMENLSLDELLQKAQKAETTYHFSKAVDLYKQAIALENDKDYQAKLPIIYSKAAKNCQKIADVDNALKYYMLAQKFYENSGELVKANYIKLSISKIYYDAYKYDLTRETLLNILQYDENPSVLDVKTYLQLANLESNLANIDGAFAYYMKAIEISDESMDIETLSELYFKYALILDDKNDTQRAIMFYEKCINLSENAYVNKFLSSAYSNMATLYLEKNDVSFAVKNYLKAYEIDKSSNNCEGMYYSASKLASILQKKYPEEALKFFDKALGCAKMLNDNFYIASASLAVGDFHYDKKQDDIALKHYVYAYELVKNEFSKDNIDKINMRINDIEFRLGEARFEGLMQKFKEEKSE